MKNGMYDFGTHRVIVVHAAPLAIMYVVNIGSTLRGG